jgi:hypothetical protein
MALFLRGFEDETKSIRMFSFMPLSINRVVKATRWVESEIIDELQRRDTKVFCIANPSDKFLLPGAFRLEVSDPDWLAEVRVLAAESDLVIVYLSKITPGLRAEIGLLRQNEFMKKTVVILARNGPRETASLLQYFPTVIVAPGSTRLNRSTFGPIFGRRRFRSELNAGVTKAINAFYQAGGKASRAS